MYLLDDLTSTMKKKKKGEEEKKKNIVLPERITPSSSPLREQHHGKIAWRMHAYNSVPRDRCKEPLLILIQFIHDLTLLNPQQSHYWAVMLRMIMIVQKLNP